MQEAKVGLQVVIVRGRGRGRGPENRVVVRKEREDDAEKEACGLN